MDFKYIREGIYKMRCLFCKENSDNTKSVEHIVPEALGNKNYILPKGYVCDKCNNYFSREVEKPFLENPEIRLLRFQEAIPNKKNRMPTIKGLYNGKLPIILKRKVSHGKVINEIEMPEETLRLISAGREKESTIIFPAFTNGMQFQSNNIISRFLSKIAVEALAEKMKTVDNSLEDLIDNQYLDDVRNHARFGINKNWPCSIRRVYDYDKFWKYADDEISQKVFECDFLCTEINPQLDSRMFFVELYFIIILWGMEFAINMGGAEIESYEKWLKEHDNVSPLYYDKNNDI